MLYRSLLLSILLGLLVLAACSGPTAVASVSAPSAETADTTGVTTAVRAVLDAQVTAWNEGRIRGFMQGYSRSDSLVFISGGSIRRGWQENFYAYMRNYGSREAMGTLSFENVFVNPLNDEYALAYGVWRLTREADEPRGRFSLLFRREAEGWRIIHDHTSSASP